MSGQYFRRLHRNPAHRGMFSFGKVLDLTKSIQNHLIPNGLGVGRREDHFFLGKFAIFTHKNWVVVLRGRCNMH